MALVSILLNDIFDNNSLLIKTQLHKFTGQGVGQGWICSTRSTKAGNVSTVSKTVNFFLLAPPDYHVPCACSRPINRDRGPQRIPEESLPEDKRRTSYITCWYINTYTCTSMRANERMCEIMVSCMLYLKNKRRTTYRSCWYGLTV